MEWAELKYDRRQTTNLKDVDTGLGKYKIDQIFPELHSKG